jgi:hypothetical protein
MKLIIGYDIISTGGDSIGKRNFGNIKTNAK